MNTILITFAVVITLVVTSWAGYVLATMTYHLTAYSLAEGYRVMFNGSGAGSN